MWDEQAAARYEKWFSTPAGSFAFYAEKRLLERLISRWPRRSQSLLEIGCGTGFFLEGFWEAGFDITGLDGSHEMLSMARKRLGDRADLHLGNAGCLPFEDREFDFVVMLTVLEFLKNPLEALQEAVRVARKGLLISFLNRHSLYHLTHGMQLPFVRKSSMRRAHWFSSGEMHKMLVQLVGDKRIVMRSVLPGPVWSWRRTPPLGWCNSVVLPGCCGGYAAVRVDLFDNTPLTPLLLFNKKPRTNPGAPQASF